MLEEFFRKYRGRFIPRDLRKNMTTGFLVLIPVLATIGVLTWGINVVDGLLDKMLAWLDPLHKSWLFRFPGRGLIIFVTLTYLTGLFARNILGRKLIAINDRVLTHIPFVRSIYSAFKQIIEAFFQTTGDSFEAVVMVQFPHPGIYSVGFITSSSMPKAIEKFGGSAADDFVCVFIPTTPIPTNGFFIQVRRGELVPLDMTVEEGLKYVVSVGVVQPVSTPAEPPPISENI